MAYCKNCGAYIPDDLTACLACGYDENQAAKEQAAAAAKKAASEIMREKLEEQRRARQEENRRWAEQEQQRRAQQEQSRQWAEEEYARRRAEQESAARTYTYRSTMNRVDETRTDGKSKLFAALSYLSFLFVLPYIVTPQDEFAKFHAKQGIKLFVFTIISDVIGAMTGIGWVLTLLRFYFIYKGMSNALNGEEEPLPYIGNIVN